MGDARVRPADIVATILLLVVHAALAVATFGVVALIAGLQETLTQDACYENCGDFTWLNRATDLAFSGGAALFLVTVVVAAVGLARHRRGFVVPLVGIVAQLALGTGAVVMAWSANPLG